MITLEHLITAQLAHWPDSCILSLSEVFSEWMDDQGAIDAWLKDFDKYYAPIYRNPAERASMRNHYVEKRCLESQLRIARSLAMCLQYPMKVFYECGWQYGGRNEDGSPEAGRFRWRGCRYGVEGHQYISGFGKD